jgi:hypothetical protein
MSVKPRTNLILDCAILVVFLLTMLSGFALVSFDQRRQANQRLERAFKRQRLTCTSGRVSPFSP